MPNEQTPLNGHFPHDDVPEQLAIAHQRLLTDGASWRTHYQPSDALWQYLHTVAHTQPDMPHASARTTWLNDSDHIVMRLTSPARPHGISLRRTFVMPAMATILVVVLLALVLVRLGMQHPHVAAIQKATSVAVKATPTTISVMAPLPQNTQLPLPKNGYLSDVAFSSASDGWATGGVRVADTPTADVASTLGFLLHYHAGIWTRYPATFAGADLDTISMSSPADGWAFGSPVIDNNNQSVNPLINAPFFLHYIGGQWVKIAFPQLHYTQDNIITKLHMFSADLGWATGTGNTFDGKSVGVAIVLFYDNGHWSDITPPPSAGDGVDVSMTSINEGWSVSNSDTIAHYQNGQWTTNVPSTLPSGQVKLDHVSMLSPSDGWISGTASTGDPHEGMNAVNVIYFILHYDGTNWQLSRLPVTPPAGDTAGNFANSQVSVIAPNDVEYAANFMNQASTLPAPTSDVVIVHYINGQWETEHFPATGINVTTIVSDGQSGIWAIGSQGIALASPTYVFYWYNGIWRTYGHS